MNEEYLEQQNYCRATYTFTVQAPCKSIDLSNQCSINDISISPTNPQINQTVYITYQRSFYNNNQYCRRKIKGVLTVKDPNNYVAKTCEKSICIEPRSYGTVNINCNVVVNKAGTWKVEIRLEDQGEC